MTGTRIWRLEQAVQLMLALLLAFAAALPAAATSSQAPYRRLEQFHHTRWTIQDGAPGQISAMAQTRDGEFWLTAAQSLYRFDGVRFERFNPADGQRFTGITLLHPAPDGALWIAFQGGGVARLHAGTLTRFDEASGAPSRTTAAFASDRDGAVWAASRSGLYRFKDERWQRIDAQWRFPPGMTRSVTVARDGTVWVASENSILLLPPGSRHFVATGLEVGWIFQLREAPDGRMWISESGGGVHAVTLVDGKAVIARAALDVESAGLLFARDGSLWATTLGDGLRRLRDPAPRAAADAVESFSERDGLSADYTWPILQDREGNIWVGSSGGLDRFRAGSLVPTSFPPGSHDFALVADEDGAIWAGTTNRPLMHLHGEQLSSQTLGEPVRCAYRDPAGRIWLGGDRTLWQIVQGRPRRVASLPTGSQQVQAMAMAGDGALWAGFTSGGLWRWQDGTWRRESARLGLRPDEYVHSAISDRRGRLWFGLDRGDVVLVDAAQVRTLALAREFKLGRITALAQGRDSLWIGGQFGLARYDGQRVLPVQIDSEEGIWGISAIIELGNGDVWVHAVPGIFRLSAAQLRAARADRNHRMQFKRFDFLDGLPGRPTLSLPLPGAVAGSDGRLWFATSNGVVWIDPAQIARNPLPPPVLITGLAADGKRFAPTDAIRLPVRVKNLEIAYTALSLTIPARVNFRYRLEGFDDGWQNVGNRRTAYYGPLPPGDYRFRVIASNNDGVWNETGAGLELHVPPAFYQTWWFRGLCVLAALALLVGLYLLRMRQITRAMQREMEVKHRERERIARDLHDTLLQGVQGLLLRFQSVADQITREREARVAMEAALDRADQVLSEARDRVMELRAPDPDCDLLALLAEIAQELAVDQPVAVRTVTEGEPRRLCPPVLEQALAIGREALFNAFQHAGASAIEIELAYELSQFRLRVRDDGVGIDADTLLAGHRPGHWGLRGMHERALAIGGTLRVWGGEGAGTEVELRVPVAVAYSPSPRTGFLNWLRAAISLGR